MTRPFGLSPLRPVMLGCIVIISLAVAGCEGHSIQTTSGKAYLEKHKLASRTPPMLR